MPRNFLLILKRRRASVSDLQSGDFPDASPQADRGEGTPHAQLPQDPRVRGSPVYGAARVLPVPEKAGTAVSSQLMTSALKLKE